MKKSLLMMMGMTAALFVGCTSSDEIAQSPEEIQNQAPQAVEFGTYLGKNDVMRTYTSGPITNATTGDNSLKSAEFGVFAKLTSSEYAIATASIAPNFMYNQEIKWSSSSPENKWVYSPVKYWPNGIDADGSGTSTEKETQYLSFFAFAPYTASGTTAYSAYSAFTDGKKPSAITSDESVKKTDKTSGVVAMTTNDYTGNVWVKYAMGSSAKEDDVVDLLWGTNGATTYDETDAEDPSLGTIGAGYNINLTKQKVDGNVKFLFKHALSKIGGATATGTESTTGDPGKCGFKVVVDVDGNSGDGQSSYFASGFDNKKTLVTLNEVKIQDGKAAADDTNVPVSSTTNKLYTSGWFNIETGSWCEESGTYGESETTTYSITANDNSDLDDTTYWLNEKILEIGAGKSDADGSVKKLKDTGTEWSDGNPVGVTTEPVPLFANEDVPALVVIPAPGSELYITVDYFVRTADPNLAAGYSQVEQVITNKVSLASLNPNKYYTIILHLGLTSVKFEAVVSDWQTKSDSSIDGTGAETEGSTPIEETIWLPSNVVPAS